MNNLKEFYILKTMTEVFENWTAYDDWLIENYNSYDIYSVEESDGKVCIEYCEKGKLQNLS